VPELNAMLLEDIKSEIDSYLEKEKDYSSALNIYRALFIVHDQYLSRIEVQINADPEELNNYLRQGKYLLSEETIDIDGDLFRELLNDIVAAILENSPTKPEGLEKLPQLEELSAENVHSFIQKIKGKTKSGVEKAVVDEEIDQKTGVDKEIIAFTLLMSIIPFYSCYAREIAGLANLGLWQKGYCPVCGQRPHIAKFRVEDGARIMGCWLCRTQWRFARLACPFCENRDQGSLQFFYVEENKVRRVYVCEKCKGYVKTVDSKMMGKDVILDIESIVTMHLDLKAVKEGYKPPEEAIAVVN